MITKIFEIMKYILLFIIQFSTIWISNSQQLYFPNNIEKAIKEKTRSLEGKPGINYWQNKSNYEISAKLDTKTSTLYGSENISYYNNSPDTLTYITFHIFQNIYKKGVCRLNEVSNKDLTNGIEIKQIYLNGKIVEENHLKPQGTQLYLKLKNKFKPGEKIDISIDWSFKIPANSDIRMGKYNNHAYFMGQWFPKIAVYDDIDGWDKHAHTGMAEFYGEYSNYKVSIEVPQDYIVQATGEMINEQDILKKETLEKLNKAKNSDKPVIIVTAEDYKKGITKQGNQTWTFEANNVPDFGFCCSKYYIWEGAYCKPKGSQKKIFVDAIYNPKSEDFKEVVDFSVQTIKYLSEILPGIPYPYSHMTTFNGSGGMEYPMITNNGSEKTRRKTVYVTTHEITHTYFPFMAGISETKYGWFDEGFTVVIPEELQDKIEPSENQAKKQTNYFEKYLAGSENEPVLMTPTYYLDRNIYFGLNYGKSETAIRMLKYYLGDAKFQSLLKEFLLTWKSKHPTPYDFFLFSNSYLKENLNWFWKRWFFEYAKPDLAISNIKNNNNDYNIEIHNIGGLQLPIELTFEFTDGTKDTKSVNMGIWKNGSSKVEIPYTSPKTIKYIYLGNDFIPDKNKEDNKKNL